MSLSIRTTDYAFNASSNNPQYTLPTSIEPGDLIILSFFGAYRPLQDMTMSGYVVLTNNTVWTAGWTAYKTAVAADKGRIITGYTPAGTDTTTVLCSIVSASSGSSGVPVVVNSNFDQASQSATPSWTGSLTGTTSGNMLVSIGVGRWVTTNPGTPTLSAGTTDRAVNDGTKFTGLVGHDTATGGTYNQTFSSGSSGNGHVHAIIEIAELAGTYVPTDISNCVYWNSGDQYSALANGAQLTSPWANRVPGSTTPTLITAGATLTASTEYPTWTAQKLIDGLLPDANSWSASGSTLPAWVQIQLSQTRSVDLYAMTARASGVNLDGSPKDFTFEGSANGTSGWVVLNTQTGVTWTAGQRRTFTVSSPASYQYYRLNITAVQGGGSNWPSFSEWELYEGTTPTGATFTPAAGAVVQKNPDGRTTVRYNTTGAATMSLPNIFNSMTAGEIFVVFRNEQHLNANNNSIVEMGASGQQNHWVYSGDGQFYTDWGRTDRPATGAPNWETSAGFFTYNVRAGSGAWSDWINGTNLLSGSATMGWRTNPQVARSWTGEIVAIVAYSRVLTGLERAKVQRYLDSITRAAYTPNAYEQAILADKPAMFFPLTESVGNSTARNIAQPALDGALRGTTPPTPAALSNLRGNAMFFNGSTSYIEAPNSAVIYKWTVETWFNLSVAPTVSSCMVHGIGNYSSGFIPFALGFNMPNSGPNYLEATFYNGSWIRAQYTGALNTGQWYHAAGTYDGTTIRLYLNGVEVANTATTGFAPPAFPGTTRIGRAQNAAGGVPYFNGHLQDVAVYSQPLTAQKIQDHYYAGINPYTNAFADAGTYTAVGTFAFNTSTFTTEASEPLGNGPALNTAWAKFTPSSDGTYQFDTIGSAFDTALAVYTGTALGSLTLLKADDSTGGSSNAKVVLALQAGQSVYVQVGGANGATGGAIVVNTTSVIGVLQDDFLAGGFISVGVLTSTAADLTPNTLKSNPDAETVIAGCDLTVNPGGSVAMTYDLQGSQNAGGQGKGVTWRIRRDNLAGAILVNSGNKAATVDSSGGNDSGMAFSGSFTDSSPTTGHYVLTSEGTGAAVTTTFIAKSVFTLSGALPSTAGFTTETGEPLTMPVAATGWVRFKPAISGYYTFSTVGSSFDTGVAVYSGSVITSLTLITSDNNTGASGAAIATAHLTGGVVYPIQIGAGSGTATGNVLLTTSAVGYDTTLDGTLVLATSQGTRTAWLIKGRSSRAQDALPGG